MKAILEGGPIHRIMSPQGFGDAHNGAAIVRTATGGLRVVFSDGMGWDHVSVSRPDRCPTWAEMCAVKDLFFHADDVVVQFHPAASEYRNLHPFCLHLWRWQEGAFPTPDPITVAPAFATKVAARVALPVERGAEGHDQPDHQ